MLDKDVDNGKRDTRTYRLGRALVNLNVVDTQAAWMYSGRKMLDPRPSRFGRSRRRPPTFLSAVLVDRRRSRFGLMTGG